MVGENLDGIVRNVEVGLVSGDCWGLAWWF